MFIENTKSGFAKFLEYALYGFFAIFPFFIFNSFLYQGSSSRFLLLSLFAAVLAIGFGIHLLYARNRVSILKSPLLIVAVLYLVLLFVSAIFGVDFGASFWSRAERTSGLFYLTHLAVFILFLVHVVSRRETREKLLKVVIGTGALYSFCSLLGPQGFDLIFKNNPYDGFMFGNSSFAAMYLLGAFLLSLYFAFRKREGKVSWYWYLAPILIMVNPFFINITRPVAGVSDIIGIAKASSIALFAALAMLLVFSILGRLKNIKIKRVFLITFMVISVGALVFVVQSLLDREGIVRKVYEQDSSLARSLVWDIARDSIRERPILGWGGDNFYSAFQSNFDNRLLEEAYGNEPWFDRAHNVVLDQTVDTGYLGVSAYFLFFAIILLALGYVIVIAKDGEDRFLGTLLFIYFYVHILELQTAFDTTISYVMLGLMFALTVHVFNKVRTEEGRETTLRLGGWLRYSAAGVFIGYFTWSLLFGVFPFWKTQVINGEIRTVGSAEKRIPLYEKLFSTKVDRAGVLWRTTTDFQQGIAANPEILDDQKKKEFLLEELGVITKGYEEYVADHPESFRPYLNVADLYVYHMLFGVDRLDEADVAADKAITLSDKHPQPYWIKAVTSLYRRDFKKAREYVNLAKAVNEHSVETKKLEKYIEDSIKTFPNIGLYSFNQI